MEPDRAPVRLRAVLRGRRRCRSGRRSPAPRTASAATTAAPGPKRRLGRCRRRCPRQRPGPLGPTPTVDVASEPDATLSAHPSTWANLHPDHPSTRAVRHRGARGSCVRAFPNVDRRSTLLAAATDMAAAAHSCSPSSAAEGRTPECARLAPAHRLRQRCQHLLRLRPADRQAGRRRCADRRGDVSPRNPGQHLLDRARHGVSSEPRPGQRHLPHGRPAHVRRQWESSAAQPKQLTTCGGKEFASERR